MLRLVFGIVILGNLVNQTPSYAGSQTGGVSYYHEGKHTASGERFNKYADTCAHRSLPFGTVVKIKGATCRVNDRGPFVRGRILDVSLGVARKLAMLGSGVIRTTISW